MITKVYILAGGASQRFGSDKARLEIDGTPNWRLLADLLAEVGEVVLLTGVQGRLADIELRKVSDNVQGRGPLGGLEAALTDALNLGADCVFLVSVDMTGVQLPWVLAVIEEARERRTGAYYANKWQPLLAAYHVDLLDEVRQRLADDTLAMWRLLEGVGARPLTPPDGWNALISINRPEDLKRI